MRSSGCSSSARTCSSCPNLPDRGVTDDLSWLSDTVPAGELQKLQAAATDRPAVQQTFGIQARNLARLNAAGVRIALGTDGNVAYAHHIEMEDMVAAGMTPAQVIVAATRNAAELLKLTDVGTVADRQERGFPRPRREPARQHHEHAADLLRLSSRHGRRPRGAARKLMIVDGPLMISAPPSSTAGGAARRRGLTEASSAQRT